MINTMHQQITVREAGGRTVLRIGDEMAVTLREASEQFTQRVAINVMNTRYQV